MTVKILGRYLLGAVLVVMAFAMLSCGDEASQAEELCKGGCTVYQDCAEELFYEEFRDLAECIETCHDNWQYNYDHDLAIDIEAHGPGAKRCFDLEIEYTICFDKNATCGEWSEVETPRECYGIADKTVACWDDLEDVGTTDPISTDDTDPISTDDTDPISTDDTDPVTGGECNTADVANCEQQFTGCLQQADMAACMEDFCQCLDATGCETYESCMEDYA